MKLKTKDASCYPFSLIRAGLGTPKEKDSWVSSVLPKINDFCGKIGLVKKKVRSYVTIQTLLHHYILLKSRQKQTKTNKHKQAKTNIYKK